MLAAQKVIDRTAQEASAAPSLVVASDGGDSTGLPSADALLQIWLAVSILFIVLASVPAKWTVHYPGVWHLARMRGPLALAGVTMMLGIGMGYLIVLLGVP